MDAILTDSNLDTRTNRSILMNVIVPKLECAEVWEGNAKLVRAQTTAAKKSSINRMLKCEE